MKITIHDVAKRAGVSLSTVSQVFNNPDRVGKIMREKVLEAAYHVGYIHRKKRKRRLGTIGIVCDNFANVTIGEFYNVVVWGILEELKKMKFNVMVEAVSFEEDRIPQMVVQNQVDGVLFLGIVNRQMVLMTSQKNIPLVMVGHPIPDLELHNIVPDGRAGALLAANYLIEKGHKRIAVMLGGPRYDQIVSDRLDGFRFGLSNAGLKLPEEYIVKADFSYPDDTTTKATEKLLKLKKRPTAIFCMADSLAFRCIRTLKDNKIKVPKDIAVVGFDHIHIPGFAIGNLPELTTVNIDQRELGQTAVKTLIEVIANPDKPAMRYTMPVSLMEGKTA